MTKCDDTAHDNVERLRVVRMLAGFGVASVLALAVLAAWTTAGSVPALAIAAVVTITTAAIRAAKVPRRWL